MVIRAESAPDASDQGRSVHIKHVQVAFNVCGYEEATLTVVTRIAERNARYVDRNLGQFYGMVELPFGGKIGDIVIHTA